jgi:predicted nuclease with TOPRIM domain
MENDNEILNQLRIEVAKQKENIDSLRTNVDKFESRLNELTSLIKNGYIDERVIKTIKQNDELMDKIIGDTLNKKFGKFVIGLISANIITLITLIITLLGGE